jgi:hypothetical protein
MLDLQLRVCLGWERESTYMERIFNTGSPVMGATE